ncbi:RING finger protein B isoform X2 [Olea europaea var. sylvestris]|uniref:RING finger protein B isoform X2 n=1 Tax=Olea europaea var. sylvestris TaxID=158386 RepID=UPI000C1D03DF|nr:RING finger protein B isoform X2 [Olea europaea var. sylvestris]
MMRWEKVQQQRGGPGVRWGHTCNAIRGGKLLYLFGGYGKDRCQTNQVHVFDTVNMTWSEPLMKGILPTPRDSHSCTTIGDNLFVFGGTDGKKPLNDLHILDTSSNMWISPSVRGDGPEAREGHSAALIGKRLFIFGGCGKSENNEIYYDDLYILNTETFSWKRVVPSGTPPSKRDSHTCSSWRNKIIVIGGEDSCDYYLSDVHILDADTLVWCKFNTMGQLLPPRGGHTTIAFGKTLFVFGGFSDEQNLYDDVYMLDLENGIWTKVIASGEGPSGRFSMAGESLDPQMGGVLVFIGGCNKNLEALDDMYYLHTGLSRENERDERRMEKLSLRKQLKLKCRVQNKEAPAYEPNYVGVEHDATVYHPMPISSYMPSGGQNFYLNEHQGKRSFQAKVTKSVLDGYTIETVIDGKLLRGVLFSNKPISKDTVNDVSNRRKMEDAENDSAQQNDNHRTAVQSSKHVEHYMNDVAQTDSTHDEKRVAEVQMEAANAEMKNPALDAQVEAASTEMRSPATVEFSSSEEVIGASEPAMVPDVDTGSHGTDYSSFSNAEILP